MPIIASLRPKATRPAKARDDHRSYYCRLTEEGGKFCPGSCGHMLFASSENGFIHGRQGM
jgi:hypothetical protein